MKNSLLKPTRKLQRKLAFLVCFYFPLLVFLAAVYLQNKVPVPILLRDVFSSADIPSYTGLVSNMGIFIWAIVSSICGFSFVLLIKQHQVNKKVAFFVFYGGCLSFLMMLDDGLMLHERFFYNYFNLPEKVTMAIYGCLVLFLLIRYQRIIRNSDFTLLVFAIIFFGLSLVFDTLFHSEEIHNEFPLTMLLEDGNKLLGIVSWAAYFINFCFDKVQSLIGKRERLVGS